MRSLIIPSICLFLLSLPLIMGYDFTSFSENIDDINQNEHASPHIFNNVEPTLKDEKVIEKISLRYKNNTKMAHGVKIKEINSSPNIGTLLDAMKNNKSVALGFTRKINNSLSGHLINVVAIQNESTSVNRRKVIWKKINVTIFDPWYNMTFNTSIMETQGKSYIAFQGKWWELSVQVNIFIIQPNGAIVRP